MCFLMATVPHAGSRIVANRMNVSGGLQDETKPLPRWGHIWEEVMGYLTETPVPVFSTWRDPLAVAISWEIRYEKDREVHLGKLGAQNPAPFYLRLLELRRRRPVGFFDMRFFPNGSYASTHHRLKQAYAERDIKVIETLMPEPLKALREVRWDDFPTEAWWR